MPSTAYNSLLAVAEQVKLFITPSRQTFAELPCGAVPLWSEDFFTWCITKFSFQNFPASITYNKVLRTLDENAQAQPREAIQPANLRTATTKGGYQIDLGAQSVEVTGKHWKIASPAADAIAGSFLRPIASRALPLPTHSDTPLPDHLRTAFGLPAPDENRAICPAKALGQWLELALRPDTECPPLILTGELRDEAAEAIRNLIDPASCAMLPFPTGRNEAAWMALYNRVLAFPIYGKITEFKRKLVKELSRGLFNARIRQTDHKDPRRFEQLGRPVILTMDKAADICLNQIVIEINQCNPLPQQEVLAALFNQMVRSLRNEPKPQHELMEAEAANMGQPLAILHADPPGP